MSDQSSGQFSLLKSRRFAPFFFTQFLGAFNDNLYKNVLTLIITFYLASWAPEWVGIDSNLLVNMAAVLFILPFFLFSATAGQLSDKYEKSQMMRGVKILEIVIMSLAAIAFYFQSVLALIVLLFLMGTQSTIFGPAKYSILPQHLQPKELVGGNGLVEMGTFLAILLGTIVAGILIGWEAYGIQAASILIVGIAVLGWLTSRQIPSAPSHAPDLKINWNPITQTVRTMRYARENRTVFLAILGISWFWAYGAVYLAQMFGYTRDVLGGDSSVVTLLLTMFSIGIGLGSLLCEKLSGKRVELGLVPFGAIGLTYFGVDLYWAEFTKAADVISMGEFVTMDGAVRILLDMAFIGMFGGFYIVPLYALVQSRSREGYLSRIIAALNILNALFMVVAGGYAMLALSMGLSIPELFLVTSIMSACVTLFIFSLVPEFLMRFIVWILISLLYRIRQTDLDKIPEEGPVLLVCNHVSFVDALVIGGVIRRPVRFVMDHNIFKIPLLKFVFKVGKTIPIAPAKEDPAMLERAYERVAEELAAGEVVCIFPEGFITRTGNVEHFRNGIERIVADTPIPVVPLALRGLWGSFFSRYYGKAMAQLPRRFWSKIELVAGDPVPPEQATAAKLHEQVVALRRDWQ